MVNLETKNRLSSHPLTIEGQNILELSRSNPVEAHRLVARAVGEDGHRAFFSYRGKQECISKAMAKPLPGASERAFTKGEIKAGNRVVYRVVPIHFAAMQALQSPMLKMVENATTQQKSEVNFSPQQQWELCHLFTANPKEVFADLYSPEGAEIIRKKSSQIGLDWEASEVNFVMLAIVEQMKRHIETTIKFAADMEAKGDVSFFREQPGEALKTAE